MTEPPIATHGHPLQVTSRRHPLALASYLIAFAFGALFITGGIRSIVIRQTISPLFVIAWEWSMLLGGLAAILGVLWRPLDHGLFTEAVGALACAFGLATYTGAVIYIAGVRTPTWILTGFLVIGCAVRAAQAYRDLQRVEAASRKPAAVFVLRPEPGGSE